MEIRPEQFEKYGEVDCHAHLRDVQRRPFSLRIRRVGNGEKDYQLYAKYSTPTEIIRVPRKDGVEEERQFWPSEVVLLNGTLEKVVEAENQLTGHSDVVVG